MSSRQQIKIIVALLSVFAAMLLASCENEASLLETAYSNAATATPESVADDLVAWWQDDERISLSSAMDLAFDKLETDPDDPTAPRFGMAVLIALDTLRADLPTGGEFEMFWRRIGRIAFWTASRARDQGEAQLAQRAMLGGPDRWQNMNYWRRYPDHDALIAYIMAENGQRFEAIRRLQKRIELTGPAEAALKALQGGG